MLSFDASKCKCGFINFAGVTRNEHLLFTNHRESSDRVYWRKNYGGRVVNGRFYPGQSLTQKFQNLEEEMQLKIEDLLADVQAQVRFESFP